MNRSALELQRRVQGFVRAWGLLAEDVTPCGQPVSPRVAHALLAMLEAERARSPLGQAALREQIRVDKSNVTRLVQKLVDSEWVEQSAGDDARSRLLSLTAKGRRVAERIEGASRDRFASLLRGIPEKKRDQVLESLALIEEAARAIRD